eukprot:COSAG02_NODE_799_length_17084_cov_9.741242_16_plen_85_part_00
MPTTATSASLPGVTGSDTQWIVGTGEVPDASPVETLASSTVHVATRASIRRRDLAPRAPGYAGIAGGERARAAGGARRRALCYM